MRCRLLLLLAVAMLASCGGDDSALPVAATPARLVAKTGELELPVLRSGSALYADVRLRLHEDGRFSVMSWRQIASSTRAPDAVLTPALSPAEIASSAEPVRLDVRRLHKATEVLLSWSVLFEGGRWRQIDHGQGTGALVEHDFGHNLSLEANENHVLVLQASDGEVSEYPLRLQRRVYRFCHDEPDAGHADRLEVVDPLGKVVVAVAAGDPCASLQAEPGRYTVRHFHDPKSVARAVFVHPRQTGDASTLSPLRRGRASGKPWLASAGDADREYWAIAAPAITFGAEGRYPGFLTFIEYPPGGTLAGFRTFLRQYYEPCALGVIGMYASVDNSRERIFWERDVDRYLPSDDGNGLYGFPGHKSNFPLDRWLDKFITSPVSTYDQRNFFLIERTAADEGVLGTPLGCPKPFEVGGWFGQGFDTSYAMLLPALQFRDPLSYFIGGWTPDRGMGGSIYDFVNFQLGGVTLIGSMFEDRPLAVNTPYASSYAIVNEAGGIRTPSLTIGSYFLGPRSRIKVSPRLPSPGVFVSDDRTATYNLTTAHALTGEPLVLGFPDGFTPYFRGAAMFADGSFRWGQLYAGLVPRDTPRWDTNPALSRWSDWQFRPLIRYRPNGYSDVALPSRGQVAFFNSSDCSGAALVFDNYDVERLPRREDYPDPDDFNKMIGTFDGSMLLGYQTKAYLYPGRDHQGTPVEFAQSGCVNAASIKSAKSMKIEYSVDILIRGRSCKRCNLEGVDLTAEQFKSVDLRRIDLRGSNLEGAVLTGLDLTEADLRYASLLAASLDRANLQRANLCGAVLTALTSRAGTIARAANLSHAYLRDTNLAYAQLNAAVFSGASFYGSTEVGSCPAAAAACGNIDDGAPRPSTCASAYKAVISGADFSNAYMANVNFDGANGHAVFSGAVLVGASFRNAVLSSNQVGTSSFTSAWLLGADFSNATLDGAVFSGAYMTTAKGGCRSFLLSGDRLTFPGLTVGRDVRSCTAATSPVRALCVQVAYSAETKFSSLPVGVSANVPADGASGGACWSALPPRSASCETAAPLDFCWQPR
jgi:uncharacterized protein YjbI with pentapeptide repeats